MPERRRPSLSTRQLLLDGHHDENKRGSRPFVPIEAWASKAQKRIVVYFGLPLD
ncbi:MAG TPA: hypothetical protein VHT91_38655 [Kofleriaceae bacterium]|jgi:hypothetical protein|nr:hypothetical protein [Kofleriaceae bacterium]